jgi:hypothetical protein
MQQVTPRSDPTSPTHGDRASASSNAVSGVAELGRWSFSSPDLPLSLLAGLQRDCCGAGLSPWIADCLVKEG